MAVCWFAVSDHGMAAMQAKGKPVYPLEPGSGFDRTFDADGQQELSRLCAEKTLKFLPLASVSTSALSLGQITLHIESGYYTVLLPVSPPQSDMRSLYWGADTIEEATTFIRLLQGGKIKTLKVEAFSEEFRAVGDTRVSTDDLRACAVDAVKPFLKPCQDCFIVEWVFDGRLD
jgi:hypothetical protein